jgi:hypothetical protein
VAWDDKKTILNFELINCSWCVFTLQILERTSSHALWKSLNATGEIETNYLIAVKFFGIDDFELRAVGQPRYFEQRGQIVAFFSCSGQIIFGKKISVFGLCAIFFQDLLSNVTVRCVLNFNTWKKIDLWNGPSKNATRIAEARPKWLSDRNLCSFANFRHLPSPPKQLNSSKPRVIASAARAHGIGLTFTQSNAAAAAAFIYERFLCLPQLQKHFVFGAAQSEGEKTCMDR